MEEQKLFNDIFDLCSSKSSERFKMFSRLDHCDVSEILEKKTMDNINYRSEVLLYGVSVTIRLQLFYNCEFVGSMLTHLYDDIKKNTVVDFFNEVGNLTGGKIKEILMGQGIVTALSLPMSISTNKTLSPESEEVLPHFKYFKMSSKSRETFIAKISFEIHDLSKFANFDKNYSKPDSQDGDVDFF